MRVRASDESGGAWSCARARGHERHANTNPIERSRLDSSYARQRRPHKVVGRESAQEGAQVAATSVPRGPRGYYRKSAERRRRIVTVAAQVFSRDGYRGATIRQIAAEAEMSPSSLLHFFGSKQELLWATMAHRDAHKFTGGKPGVRGFPDRVVGQAVANEEIPHLIQLYAVLSAESATRDHPAQEYFATRVAKVRQGVASEVAALADAGLQV